MQLKYKKLDIKIRKLTQAQTLTPRQIHNFYPRVINNTNLPFSDPDVPTTERVQIQSTLEMPKLVGKFSTRSRNSSITTAHIPS
jgi:hypothetical protein